PNKIAFFGLIIIRQQNDMKNKHVLKISTLFGAGLMVTVAAAQNTATIEGTTPLGSTGEYRTWSVGVNAGVLNQTNILGFNRAGFDKLEHNLGYSAYIKKQLSPSFGLKAQYLGGKVGGTNEASASAMPGTVAAYETNIPW